MLRAFLPQDRDKSWFDSVVAEERRFVIPWVGPKSLGFDGGHKGGWFCCDVAALGITDTVGVARFIETLFAWRASVPSPPRASVKSVLRDLTPPVLWRAAKAAFRRA
jgi:hypothetical protein